MSQCKKSLLEVKRLDCEKLVKQPQSTSIEDLALIEIGIFNIGECFPFATNAKNCYLLDQGKSLIMKLDRNCENCELLPFEFPGFGKNIAHFSLVCNHRYIMVLTLLEFDDWDKPIPQHKKPSNMFALSLVPLATMQALPPYFLRQPVPATTQVSLVASKAQQLYCIVFHDLLQWTVFRAVDRSIQQIISRPRQLRLPLCMPRWRAAGWTVAWRVVVDSINSELMLWRIAGNDQEGENEFYEKRYLIAHRFKLIE